MVNKKAEAEMKKKSRHHGRQKKEETRSNGTGVVRKLPKRLVREETIPPPAESKERKNRSFGQSSNRHVKCAKWSLNLEGSQSRSSRRLRPKWSGGMQNVGCVVHRRRSPCGSQKRK